MLLQFGAPRRQWLWELASLEGTQEGREKFRQRLRNFADLHVLVDY